MKLFMSLALTIAFLIAGFSGATANAQVIRIEVGDKTGSSKEELERRVWDLERAVRQLQNRIYDLESDRSRTAGKKTTCSLESFGKVFNATEDTEMAAKAKVLKACADATNSIHCDKSKVECGN
ncbi:hypothetical protein BH10BDE1_BH10BDE1_11680 [soil metagenome]